MILMDRETFGRYLLREFFWELDQHESRPAILQGLSQDQVEVIDFAGYDELRLRLPGSVLNVRLSWRKDTPPSVVVDKSNGLTTGCS